jgi:hypothetical protein
MFDRVLVPQAGDVDVLRLVGFSVHQALHVKDALQTGKPRPSCASRVSYFRFETSPCMYQRNSPAATGHTAVVEMHANFHE